MTEEIGPRAHGRTPETDEVLRRIGRNVVNFQQVEELLKYLNAHSRIKSPVSQLAAHVEGRAEAVHKKTMGDPWQASWSGTSSRLRLKRSTPM